MKLLCGFNRSIVIGVLVTAGWFPLGNSSAVAEVLRDDCETADTSWSLIDHDCQLVLQDHKRVFHDAHAGAGCERFRLKVGNGTYIYLGHELDRARVISELEARVCVRANRPGIQLLARVILPRARQAGSDRPMSTLVRGDVYSQAGEWEQLALRDMPTLVQRQVRLLRSQLSSPVDDREAYIDLVLLNGYSGPGTTEVSLDSLDVRGIVPVDLQPERQETAGWVRAAAATNADGIPPTPTGPASRVRFDGPILLVDERPIMPRIIQYCGESFEYLKTLGFNTIELPNPPTTLELDEARRLGLWLVSPPPQRGTTVDIQPVHDRILAWHLGKALTDQQLEFTRQFADKVRRTDPQSGRPLVGSPDTQLRRYSRHLDVLLLGKQPLGTSFDLSRYGDWLHEREGISRRGTPIWATVQTEPSAALMRQIAALGPQEQPRELSVQHEQIELLAFIAAAAGARGLRFHSRTPLDTDNPASRDRSTTLELLNRRMAVIEPWVAAGTRVTTIETSDPQVRAAVLATDRSRLLMLLRRVPDAQYEMNPTHKGKISFVVPGTAGSNEPYQITATRLKSVRHKRVTGGMRINLEEVNLTALLILTQDPLVVSRLTNQLAGSAVQVIQLRQQLAESALARTEKLTNLPSMQAGRPAGADVLLNEAHYWLTQSRHLNNSADTQATDDLAAKSLRSVARLRHTYWDHANRQIQQPVASPFLVGFETLPMHWALATRLASAPVAGNALAGGDFESLDHMYRRGWRHYRHPQEGLESDVELTPRDPRSGRYALRLHVWSTARGGGTAVVESPPLWINSAPVRVKPGQLIRIEGWVQIPGPISGCSDGLMIFDSIAGQNLSLRLQRTGGWQQFVFYRVADRPGDVTVTFALSGLGEAVLDELTVSPFTLSESHATPLSGRQSGPRGPVRLPQ